MELTVLGRYSPYPPPGGAMNGYLVRHGATSVLIDAGSGVASRLQEHIAVEQLSGVVVSHLHEDHISDLHCLRFAWLAALDLGRTSAKLQIWAPDQPADRHRWIEGGEDWQDLHTYDPAQPLIIGELLFEFTRTVHPLPCYAMRITPVGQPGPVLFYTADTGYSLDILEAAQGADLLLAEASLIEEYASRRHLGHLTAAEAASLARDTAAKRCVLTHLWPALDPQRLLDEGRPVHANIELAKEGKTYRL